MHLKKQSALKYGTVISLFYPVGSIVTNTLSSYDPNKEIGGEWELLPDNIFYSAGAIEVNDKSNSFTLSADNIEKTTYSMSGGAHNNHWYSRATYPWWAYQGWNAVGGDHTSGLNYPQYQVGGGAHTHTVEVGINNPLSIDVTNIFNQYSVFIWKRVK